FVYIYIYIFKCRGVIFNWQLVLSIFVLHAASLCLMSLFTALCEYDGKQYSMGESWMEQGCVQCTCLHPMGVGCCETVHRPVDFPPWCEVQVESLTCQVRLVMTSDPRLPCIPGEENNVDPRHGALNMKL
uniref:Prostate-associated microseminoprotein n=1 Tax=Cyprinus carpio TaxID=7962 RepID=A0A8C1IUT7_CYPCA